MRHLKHACSAALVILSLSTETFSAPPAQAPRSADRSPAMVIGIVGGYVRRDSRAHGLVQFAEHLRQEFPEGVYVGVFENHRWKRARDEIRGRLDTDHNGTLSAEEKGNARIVLYGHSWGASEIVHLAEVLGKDGVPVLLTIQVDSVQKSGQNDSVIPANVAQAINFYQRSGWPHGRKEIRAADPARTEILGNVGLEYKSASCPGYPWYNRWFTKAHCAIEIDNQVWDRAEALIRSTLLASSATAAQPAK